MIEIDKANITAADIFKKSADRAKAHITCVRTAFTNIFEPTDPFFDFAAARNTLLKNRKAVTCGLYGAMPHGFER